ncbi:MAG: UvrB/UvrC motif-containing protein, partial [Bacteroidota bacterium]
TIKECNRRREKQMAYNTEHGITPCSIRISPEEIIQQSALLDIRQAEASYSQSLLREPDPPNLASSETKALPSNPQSSGKSAVMGKQNLRDLRKQMNQAAKDMDFLLAAKLRDQIKALENSGQ